VAVEIEVEISEDVFLPVYRHLLKTETNLNFLWGGRDSGKSYFIAQQMIIACLMQPYFRCILVKKTAESIQDAQYQTIKDICEDWGVDHLFTFGTSPLKIQCVNGNKFIARGCDKPGKLKSIANPSDVWYEEGNQLTLNDYIIVSTTLRSNKGPIREWFSFNPECEDGDPADHWLYKIFFKKYYEKGIMTFTGSADITTPDKKVLSKRYSSTHTTYKDNPNVTSDRIANLQLMASVSAYYSDVFRDGLWGKRITGGEALKQFKKEKHVQAFPIAIVPGYDPLLPLHLSFDENTAPYFPCGIFQIHEKYQDKLLVGYEVRMIAESLGYHPDNTITWVCKRVKELFPAHEPMVYVYGDATSDKDDVKQEKGDDLFNLIIKELRKHNFRTERRVPESNPNVTRSLDFFNTILLEDPVLNPVDGITFRMSDKCLISIKDFENTKENKNGGIDKSTVRDKDTKVTYQPFGHIVDLTRYLLTYFFSDQYSNFRIGAKPFENTVWGTKKDAHDEWSGTVNDKW
jgi:phage terminase large subunit